MSLKPNEIYKGMVFYESAYGSNIRFVAIDVPRENEIHLANESKPRKQWHWKATNTETNEVTSFTVTEGLEHYGPKIYSEPAYYCPAR